MFRFGPIQSTLAVIALGFVMTSASFADANKPFFEKNVNRWGSDYSIFDIKSGDANTCYQACAKDKQCLAWTYHRPGTKGKLGECHLKSKVAKGRSNPCCVSGVLVGQSAASGDQSRSHVTSSRLPARQSAGSEKIASQAKPKKSFFRRAKLTPGEAVGLPELTVVAGTPPLKITPVSFALSEEL